MVNNGIKIFFHIVVTPLFATTVAEHSLANFIAVSASPTLVMDTASAAIKVSPAPDKS